MVNSAYGMSLSIPFEQPSQAELDFDQQHHDFILAQVKRGGFGNYGNYGNTGGGVGNYGGNGGFGGSANAWLPPIKGGYDWQNSMARQDNTRAFANEQQNRYERWLKERQPYLDSGKRALSRLGALDPFKMGELRNTDAYNFRVSEGTRAIEAGAAARGGLFSGRAGKELATYGQNMASQEYQKEWVRQRSEHQQIWQNFFDRAYNPSPIGYHPTGGARGIKGGSEYFGDQAQLQVPSWLQGGAGISGEIDRPRDPEMWGGKKGMKGKPEDIPGPYNKRDRRGTLKPYQRFINGRKNRLDPGDFDIRRIRY